MKQEENRLHAAIKEGDYNSVRKLLNSTFNLRNQSSEENIQTIFYAVQFKHTDLVSLLVENGAKFCHDDLRKRDKEFILNLLSTGETEMMENLVKAGLELNSPLYDDTGDKILHFAADSSSKAMITKLIELWADVDCHDRHNVTPLIVAAFNGRLENVEVLLQNGADPNAVGTMFPYRCLCCSEDYTPLTAAFSSENPHVILKIVEAGANLNNLIPPFNNTVLHLAAKYDSKELILALIERGANINAINDLKHTPLMDAAYAGHLDIVKLLLEKGADPNLGDGYDLAQLKNDEILKLILKK